MKVDGRAFRSIWRDAQSGNVAIIDQTKLPHAFVIAELRGVDDAWHAIADMQVRGAPLIGVAAAYGLVLLATGELQPRKLVAAFARTPQPAAAAEGGR